MRKFPEPIQTLMTEFGRLPGVGPKTALRYVYALLALTPEQRAYFARSVTHLDTIERCPLCHAHIERGACAICTDEKRDGTVLCVIAESRDIATIEATDLYKGRYHVLGGLLKPTEGRTAEQLRILELQKRLKTSEEIREIILAISPDVYGEMTMQHLAKVLKPHGRKITRLARGLPMGADLEFADEITLGDAFTGRREA